VSILAALVISGCSHRSSEPTVVAPVPVEVRDAKGITAARVIPSHPCRAEIDGSELIVGSQPLVAQIGAVRWSGADGSNGTTLESDGTAVARLSPSTNPNELDIFDPEGVAMIKITATTPGSATIVNHEGVTVRHVDKTPAGFAVKLDDGVESITGTTDPILAGILTSPELTRPVRALAACRRVFEKLP